MLCEDDTMDVLQSIGYRGVPSKETLRSRDEIIRYVLQNTISHKCPYNHIFASPKTEVQLYYMVCCTEKDCPVNTTHDTNAGT